MVIFGFTYGVTSPVPGVDGGTIFILFNQYEKFIHAANFSEIKKKLHAVVPFVFGCLVGLFGISNLMMYLLTNHEMITYFSFAGLIAGCVPLIYKKSALNISEQKIKVKNVGIFAVALALMLLLAIRGTDTAVFEYILQLNASAAMFAWIFFASAVSAVGMLIPGVGGAILMLILGIYTIYVEALATLDITLLATLVTGMICGILSGIRLVKKILLTFPGELYCAILGFAVGSVFVVIPDFSATTEGILAIVFAVLFAVIAYLFSKKS
jgi:putative membrane protein